MQTKTTMTFHLIHVNMAVIKKGRDYKCWHTCGEKGTCVHSWWECKLLWTPWKIVWKLLKNLKIELP